MILEKVQKNSKALYWVFLKCNDKWYTHIFASSVRLHINNMKYLQRLVIYFTSSGDGILDVQVVDQIICIGLASSKTNYKRIKGIKATR